MSPFCAATILLQLLAKPLWLGNTEDVVAEDVVTGALIIVAYVVDTPT